MSSQLLVTGYTLKYNWAIRKTGEFAVWEAWIRDEEDTETGAPLIEGVSFADVVDKIQDFEKGIEYALHNN